jgi:hypothetical protein
MAEESILHDIMKKGLDPKKAHKLVGASGRLKNVDESKQLNLETPQEELKNGFVFLDNKKIESEEEPIPVHQEGRDLALLVFRAVDGDEAAMKILAKASTLRAAEQGVELALEAAEAAEEAAITEEHKEEEAEVEVITIVNKRGRKKK